MFKGGDRSGTEPSHCQCSLARAAERPSIGWVALPVLVGQAALRSPEAWYFLSFCSALYCTVRVLLAAVALVVGGKASGPRPGRSSGEQVEQRGEPLPVAVRCGLNHSLRATQSPSRGVATAGSLQCTKRVDAGQPRRPGLNCLAVAGRGSSGRGSTAAARQIASRKGQGQSGLSEGL